MIGAETLGQPCLACDLMEQAAQRSPIHCRSGVDPEPDDPTSALVHDDQHPMGLKSKGLTPKKINALQAILHRANEGQPRGSAGSVRLRVGGEDPSHDIFIQGSGQGLGDRLGNLGAPTLRIASFHFQDECKELPRRSLRTRRPAFRRREEQAIFPFDQRLMILQECGGLEENGGPFDAARIQKDGPEAQEETIEG